MTPEMGRRRARVIAAGDDLLEALKSIAAGECCLTPGCSINDPMCDAMIARAAIAKVEKESTE